MNRLPPLNALRAFEAAARHLSFTRAAAELNVTPAAVGHQVRALEDLLGLQLFRRLNRSLLLTDAAQAGMPELREGFGRLADAIETIRASGSQDGLIVTVAPTFAVKWLVPRLDRFWAAHPEIALRIDTALAELDLAREGIDIGIRYGDGRYPGLSVERLMGETLFPVCAPTLRQGPRPLLAPADLHWHVLLHIENETRDQSWPDWPTWLRVAGCTGINGAKGPRFSQTMTAVQAAIDAQGVVIAPASTVQDDLAAGRLIKPFTEIADIPTDYAWYAVTPVSSADNPRVVAFHDWIFTEAADQPPTRG